MLRAVFAASLLGLAGPAFAREGDGPREAGYRPADGERIVFDVYREGSEFGVHELQFSRDGDGDLTVEIAIRLRAGFGPITVFRYEHDSTEVWREEDLVSLAARTLKDGEVYEISAALREGALRVEGEGPQQGAFETSYPAGTLPSSHWHGYPAGTLTLLNTEFGTPLEAVVDYVGREEIEADGTTIPAHRYRLSSSLELDLWYDETGRWAGCAFRARGQDIRYVRRFDPVEGPSS